jgi:signal peptidase I
LRKLFKIIHALIWTALILFLLLVGTTFFPIPGNYKAFTVQSGSMEPKIRVGSLIFSKPAGDYNVGDIVTFKAQGGKTTVTHRIMEIESQGGAATYVTKGDANEDLDPDAVKKENIIGKTFLILPWIGYPIGYAKTKIGFILLILIPSIIIIYEELRKIGMEFKKKLKIADKENNDGESETEFKRSKSVDNILTVDIHEGVRRRPIDIAPPAKPPERRKIV